MLILYCSYIYGYKNYIKCVKTFLLAQLFLLLKQYITNHSYAWLSNQFANLLLTLSKNPGALALASATAA
jgi:hypothetical protein